MIKEEYVSYESAKLLREAGFPQDDDYKAYDSDGMLYACLWEVESECYAAPTQSQAMRWLREKCHISVEPSVTLDEQWCVGVWEFTIVEDIINDDELRYPTYEAAAEAGIQASCKYLTQNKDH